MKLDASKQSNVRQTLHGNPQRTFRSYVRQTEEVVVKAVRLSCLRRNKDHQKNLIDLLLILDCSKKLDRIQVILFTV